MTEQYTMDIPFVAGIIERDAPNGKRQILIQTRLSPGYPIYDGTFEFVAGTLDKPYENIYAAFAREIKEEAGLKLKRISDDSQTPVFSPKKTDAIFGFRPFCCIQQLKDGRPWVGFIFRCEVEAGEPKDQPGETKDVHWMDVDDFYKIFTKQPEKIFGLELPAWSYYFDEIYKQNK